MNSMPLFLMKYMFKHDVEKKMSTFRIYCGASHDLSLAIANGEVVLAKTDPCDDRRARGTCMHTSSIASDFRFESFFVDLRCLQ
jgi:hypothetical protein